MPPSDSFDRVLLAAQIAEAFSPGAPIDRYSLFAGRTPQVLEVLNAVSQRGQHVVLFGERGVGKTSLANVLTEVLNQIGQSTRQTVRVNCDRSDDFASLWRKVLREMDLRFEEQAVGFVPERRERRVTLDNMLPETPAPEDIRYIFERLEHRAIVVMDEFDRVEKPEATALMADTVKTLSDHSTDVTLMLVGVADSVDDLIREHASVERALVQVRMPRMSEDELAEIVRKGLEGIDLDILDVAVREIARLSQGLPHYTHLLALHAAQAAVQRAAIVVEMPDVDAAVQKAVTRAQQSIVQKYHAATSSPRKQHLYQEVLLSCALAETDGLGYFAAADIRDPLRQITGRQYDIAAYSRHLHEFSGSRGPVLKMVGEPRKYRFRFVNPMMQPYVLMRGRAAGVLPASKHSDAF